MAAKPKKTIPAPKKAAVSSLHTIPLAQVRTRNADTSLVDVAKYMRDERAHYIFVVDKDNAPLGVVSVTDIAYKAVAQGKDLKTLKAKDIMTAPVDSAEIGQAPEFALHVMMKRHNHACLITENGRIKGLADYKDVLQAVLKNMELHE